MKSFKKNLVRASVALVATIALMSCEGVYGELSDAPAVDTSGLIELFSGSAEWDDAASTSWTPRIIVDAADLASRSRAELSFVVAPNAAGETEGYCQFKPCADGSQTSYEGSTLNNGAWQLESAATTYTFMPTTGDWASMKADGIFFDGQNVKVTAVYLSDVPATDSGEETAAAFPWSSASGFLTGPEGDGVLTFPAALFADAVTYSEEPANAGKFYNVYVTYDLIASEEVEGAVLTLAPAAPAWMNYGNIVEEAVNAAGTYKLILDAVTLESFASYGMALSGSNLSVTSVKCGLPAVTLSSMTIFAPNLPGYEVVCKDAANSYAQVGGTVVLDTDGAGAITIDPDVLLEDASELYIELSKTGEDTVYAYAAADKTTLSNGLAVQNYKLNVPAADTGTTPMVLSITMNSSDEANLITAAALTAE